MFYTRYKIIQTLYIDIKRYFHLQQKKLESDLKYMEPELCHIYKKPIIK